MSRIDDLIGVHCPRGVQFRELRAIGTWYGGGTPSKQKPEFWTGGTIPWLSPKDMRRTIVVETEDYITEAAVRGSATKIVPANSVALVVRSSILDHTLPIALVPIPITLNQDMKAVVVCEDVLPEYLAHLMRSRGTELLRTVRKSGGSVASLEVPKLMAHQIPVPPLVVQHEIVKVLDRFTELEAELEARRQQYVHYRDALLTFPEAGGVRRIPMGELAEIRSGWGFPQAEQGLADGDFAFYKVGDMNLAGNETEMTVANNYITSATARRLRVKPAPAGTTIFPKIGAAVATNKKRLLTVDSAYDNNVMGLVPGPQVLPRYLFYWMQTFDLVKLANDSGAVPSIRKSEVEQVLVPVPDLEEQERIVGILDRFDALVNSLTDGLAAEIAARRQQYEYYRDKLLTFEEVST